MDGEGKELVQADLKFLRDPERRTEYGKTLLKRLRSYCDILFGGEGNGNRDDGEEIVSDVHETLKNFVRLNGCVVPFGSCLRGTAGEHSADVDIYLFYDTKGDQSLNFPRNLREIFRGKKIAPTRVEKVDRIVEHIFPEVSDSKGRDPREENKRVDLFDIDLSMIEMSLVEFRSRLSEADAHSIIALLFSPDKSVYLPKNDNRLNTLRAKLIRSLSESQRQNTKKYGEEVYQPLNEAFKYLFEGTKTKHPKFSEDLIEGYFLRRFAGDQEKATEAVKKFGSFKRTSPDFPSPDELAKIFNVKLIAPIVHYRGL